MWCYWPVPLHLSSSRRWGGPVCCQVPYKDSGCSGSHCPSPSGLLSRELLGVRHSLGVVSEEAWLYQSQYD